MFVGGGLMFVGNNRLVGGGCRSGVGGRLFVVLSSCCVVCVVAVRRDGKRRGTHLNNLDGDNVAQLPRRLHHPHIVVVRVVVRVCRGGCGRSVTAVGSGGRWRDGWGGGNGWRRWWWLGGKDC